MFFSVTTYNFFTVIKKKFIRNLTSFIIHNDTKKMCTISFQRNKIHKKRDGLEDLNNNMYFQLSCVFYACICESGNNAWGDL